MTAQKAESTQLSRAKEIAKFASGMAAFDAINHAALALSGNLPITFFGITLDTTVNAAGIAVFSLLSAVLAWYAWFKH